MRSHQSGTPNWLDRYCPLDHFSGNNTCAGDDDIWRRYVISLYFTTTTMTSTGYGDVVGVTNEGQKHARCTHRHRWSHWQRI